MKRKDRDNIDEQRLNNYLIDDEDEQEIKGLTKKQKTIVGIFIAVILVFVIFIIVENSDETQSGALQINTTPIIKKFETSTPTLINPVIENVINNKEPLPMYIDYMDDYPDYAGWIKIEDTIIDYPVVQNNDYNKLHCYIELGPDKKANNAGAIFLDIRNNYVELDRHTIIYGHNMKNNTMFGQLDEYKNKYYRQEHPIIEFNTLYDIYKWEIINVMITNTEFYYIETNIYTDEELKALMDECFEKCIYENDTVLEPGDKILTLSTCTNDVDDGRLVIQARLVVD